MSTWFLAPAPKFSKPLLFPSATSGSSILPHSSRNLTFRLSVWLILYWDVSKCVFSAAIFHIVSCSAWRYCLFKIVLKKVVIHFRNWKTETLCSVSLTFSIGTKNYSQVLLSSIQFFAVCFLTRETSGYYLVQHLFRVPFKKKGLFSFPLFFAVGNETTICSPPLYVIP